MSSKQRISVVISFRFIFPHFCILHPFPNYLCFCFCPPLPGLELDAGELPPQLSVSDWPELRRIFTERFASKTQADWSRIFDGTDACVTPVLSFDQVSSHPHNQERCSFMKNSSGEEFPRPAPVLSRTPAEPCLTSDPVVGEHTIEVLQEYGFTSADIDKMISSGVVECNAAKAKL